MNINTVHVLARHVEHREVLRQHGRIIPTELQLSEFIVCCEGKLSWHRNTISGERLIKDVPAWAARLRQSLEKSSRSWLISPTKSKNSVDVIKVPAVAVFDHAHSCHDTVTTQSGHICTIVSPQVRVVQKSDVHIVELDQAEGRRIRGTKIPPDVVTIGLSALMPEVAIERLLSVMSGHLLLRASCGIIHGILHNLGVCSNQEREESNTKNP
mmetsp:Transcript_36910/g.83229  ORF Transcript_36910/g.83229 Transcript_36910/m.83229 type:complete len:212 (-) Transcript_36910:240-875(-)